MDFKLNDEQREFQEKVRRFSAEVIRPIAAEHDRDESVPWEAIKAAREWGLHGLETIQLLGEDPDGIMSCIYAEEMHWGCAGIALAIQGGSLAAAGIASSGTPEQIGRWVPGVLRHGRRDQAWRLRGHRAERRLRRALAAHHRQAGRR